MIAAYYCYTVVDFALFSCQILMSALITMENVPKSVSIHKGVIIVSVPLDIYFNLTIIIVQVNIVFHVSLSN